MPQTLILIVAAALAAAFPGAASGQLQATVCERPAPRQTAEGDVVVIPDPQAVPCEASFRETSTKLKTGPLTAPVITDAVVRDRRGRFLTFGGGSVSVWNSDGSFRQSFGRPGRGPGELVQGALTIHPLRDGSVYVLDNGRRWSHFDSAYRFLEVVATGVGLGQRRTAAIDDGSLLDAVLPAAEFSFTIRPAGGSGARPPAARSFGPILPAERAVPRSARGRLVAYVGGNTFWAGPPQETDRGYELEQWSVNGKLLKTIRRTPSWLPKPRGPAEHRVPEAPPAPEIELLHDLGDGLLWVMVAVTNPTGWEAFRKAPRDSTLRARAVSLYSEVIDTRSGALIASAGPFDVGVALRTLARGGFNGTRLAYRVGDADDGEREIRIVEMILSGKRR